MSKQIKALAVAGIVLGASAIFASPAQTAPNVDKRTYVAMVKGVCPSGSVKISVRKPVRVQWQQVNGATVSKALKKGAKVCRLPVPTVNPELPSVVDGVLMRLPANFPANPTVQDIQSLGLTPQSKVSPSLRIPKPSTSIAPAVSASNVDAVSAGRPYTTTILDDYGDYNTQEVMDTTWTIKGGSGVLSFPKYDPVTNKSYANMVVLNPSETITVTTTSIITQKGIVQFVGTVKPNYGQANIPSSLSDGWRYSNTEYKPAGVNMYPTAANEDGYVLLNDDMTMNPSKINKSNS